MKWILDQIGSDPHAFKADYVGKRAVSHYDAYKQNKTGELLLRRKNSSEFIRTGIGCDDGNNSIEVTFYMESNDYINMKEIDKILNIKNAEFYSKGDLFTSPNKKVQFIIEHSYYSFGIDKEENLNEKINKIMQKIEDIKKNLNYIFKKYKLNKELIIYSWANDEATREYKISLKQIQLLSELGIELKIIHYNI